ncbi:methyltransferase [Pleurocapsa sp. CCALA 161]|uniref:MGMT family protein n=1 Tax=Pleurocapsa sp. CCALA 161 TaxID=2107688 RepID=UPI000D06B10A|nr:MGMT family protein [Pleurocapsa sp. CCALA 161]PSB08538.1 methyltransferase [Pleurocapsa sp. CCALA 161]
MSNYDRIYTTVRQIPWGKVATYGQIADFSGLYGKARLVGYALFRVQIEDDIPWHRVINAQGEISYSLQRQGGDYLQKVLLEEEGIEFNKSGKIDLNKYRWQPNFNFLSSNLD